MGWRATSWSITSFSDMFAMMGKIHLSNVPKEVVRVTSSRRPKRLRQFSSMMAAMARLCSGM